jgi:hypothetical protein
MDGMAQFRRCSHISDMGGCGLSQRKLFIEPYFTDTKSLL